MARDTFNMFQAPERGRFGDNEEASRARVTGSSDLHDLAMTLHAERPSAVLVSSAGDITKAVWLPKSQIEIELIGSAERLRNGRTRQTCRITAPQWLAKEKGLI